MIQEWIIKHPLVVTSLIEKYTMLIRDDTIDKNTHKVGKYSIQVLIRKFQNDLIQSKSEGGLSELWKGNTLLVSDTGLRYIISINVKKVIPRYNQMCGYKVCILAKQLQRSLNAWINRYSKGKPTYERIVMPNNMILYPKPRDAIDKMIYPYTSFVKCCVIVCCFI